MIEKLNNKSFNKREDFNGTKMELVRKINEIVEGLKYLANKISEIENFNKEEDDGKKN